jgi:hypothetical protein
VLKNGAGAAVLAIALLAWSAALRGEPVAVLYPERPLHAPLVLRGADGSTLADGDLAQTTRGDEVTTRVVLRFKDGSLHDETVEFSQQGEFRLIRDRLVQRGPAFPRAVDMSIDGPSGEVIVRADERGERRQYGERLSLPPDLANGLLPMMLKNVRPAAPPRSLSFVVATPKPRLVRLAIVSANRGPLPGAGGGRAAIHYVLKVEIGGVEGLLAPLFGKQPRDSHVWIVPGNPPAYVRSEQPFYAGGPLWRIDVQPE